MIKDNMRFYMIIGVSMLFIIGGGLTRDIYLFIGGNTLLLIQMIGTSFSYVLKSQSIIGEYLTENEKNKK